MASQEGLRSVVLGSTIFWDVTPYSRVQIYRRFERAFPRARRQPPAHAGSSLADYSTLKMESIRSSETSIHTRSTQRHIPEDGIHQVLFCFVESKEPPHTKQYWIVRRTFRMRHLIPNLVEVCSVVLEIELRIHRLDLPTVKWTREHMYCNTCWSF
jgi:hypothetical protein